MSRKFDSVQITVHAERGPDGIWSIAVLEYPDVTATCVEKRNIAKLARDAVSNKKRIPVGRLNVARVVCK